jgi:hypothetical protein
VTDSTGNFNVNVDTIAGGMTVAVGSNEDASNRVTWGNGTEHYDEQVEGTGVAAATNQSTGGTENWDGAWGAGGDSPMIFTHWQPA